MFELEEIEMGIDVRFSGAEYSPFIKEIPITTIGSGGIGSWFHLLISRMRPKTILNYEFDDVEIHNLGGQLFSLDDINLPKSEQTKLRLKLYSDFDSFIPLGQFEEDSDVSPVLFLCVDNNPTRMQAALNWKKLAEESNWEYEFMVNGEVYKFPFVMIDARLSFNNLDVYVVTQNEIEYHLEHRIPLGLENVLPENCTTKANPEVGCMSASYMVTMYRNWVQNMINKSDGFPETKSTPYRLNIDLSTINFKTYGLRKN